MGNKITRDPKISPSDTKRILETILHPDIKDNPYAF